MDWFLVIDFYMIMVDGGIFFIVMDDEVSVEMVKLLYVLVIIGMFKGLCGIILYYFCCDYF